MWFGGTGRLSYQSCQLVFGRRTALYLFHQVLCFPSIAYFFQDAEIGMMLIISGLRYRATVHPLKPAISRRKLEVVCGLAYIVGFIADYGTCLPLCFRMQWSDVAIVYDKVLRGCFISCFFFSQTLFMAVVYYKIGRALIKQYRYMKNEYSNPGKRSAPGFSFSILKFIRNRRTFLVSLPSYVIQLEIFPRLCTLFYTSLRKIIYWWNTFGLHIWQMFWKLLVWIQ
jgi:hypothetical protein